MLQSRDNPKSGIRRGNVVIEDLPVAHALLSPKLERYCDGCLNASPTLQPCEACGQMYYCSKSCSDAMQPLHALECRQYLRTQRLPVADIRLLLRMKSVQDATIQQQIHGLMSHEDDFKSDPEFVSTFTGMLQTIASFMGGQLPWPERELFILYCQMRINSFVITDQHGADLAPGLFLQAARLDHACKPNMEYVFRGKKIICLALEDISNPVEARISYVDTLTTTRQRREMLRKRYFFECTCSVCLDLDRDRQVSSLLCCGSSPLNESIPLTESNASSERKLLIPSQDPSDLVRCCPTCNKLYSNHPIDQLTRFLFSFTDQPPTIERAADAIRLYCLMRGLKYPGKTAVKVPIRSNLGENCTTTPPVYYRLFGRCAHNVLLVRVCRMASFALWEENTDAVLRVLTESDDLNSSRARFNRILIAAGLDYLEWQVRWRAGPQFMVGLHAIDIAGFLLRWVTDQQFGCEDFMKSINRLTASQSTIPNLGQLLCRLTLTAEDKLSIFLPYDSWAAESLKRLRTFL